MQIMSISLELAMHLTSSRLSKSDHALVEKIFKLRCGENHLLFSGDPLPF